MNDYFFYIDFSKKKHGLQYQRHYVYELYIKNNPLGVESDGYLQLFSLTSTSATIMASSMAT